MIPWLDACPPVPDGARISGLAYRRSWLGQLRISYALAEGPVLILDTDGTPKRWVRRTESGEIEYDGAKYRKFRLDTR